MTSLSNYRSTSSLEDQLEIKNIIREEVLAGVNHLKAILRHMEYNEKVTGKELKESPEFVELGEMRERLAVIREEIAELREKMWERSKACEKAEEEHAARVRARGI